MAKGCPCTGIAKAYHVDLGINLCRHHHAPRTQSIMTVEQGMRLLQTRVRRIEYTYDTESEPEPEPESESESTPSDFTRAASVPFSFSNNSSTTTTTIVGDGGEGCSSDPQCPICQSKLSKHEITELLPCHHLFHSRCVRNWLSVNPTCPICRAPIEDFGSPSYTFGTATSSPTPAPTSPTWTPTSPTPAPTSPTYTPTSPTYTPTLKPAQESPLNNNDDPLVALQAILQVNLN